jgi:hypothetical protein
MHQQLYVKDGQHFIAAVDYAQLVRNTGRTYEDMRDLAMEVLGMTTAYRATFIVASQLTQGYKRDVANGEDVGDFLAVKGGGDLEASVHNFMDVKYDGDRDPDKLTIRMRRARRGAGGRHQYKNFDIHPASGLLLLGDY